MKISTTALKRLLSGSAMLLVGFSFLSNVTEPSGSPAFCTGSPGDGATCAQSGCHTGPTPKALAGIITSNIPANGYVPGTTYSVTCTFVRKGHSVLAFEVSPQNTNGASLGTIVNTSSQTKIVTGGPTNAKVSFITHSSTGTAATNNTKTWSFNWTAPAKGTGNVTFYGAFLACNGNTKESGDSVFTSTLAVSEDVTLGLKEAAINGNSLSMYPNPVKENAQIRVALKEAGVVMLDVYDLSGKLVQHVHAGQLAAGEQFIPFQRAESLKSGIYFISLQQGNNRTVQKFILE